MPFVIPICIWVAYSDMSRMKIPNYAVLAMAGVFIVLGPFVFELGDYFWRILGGVIVLAIGFLMNQLRLIGAGDAKFAAAMAPFFAAQHFGAIMILFSVCLLASFVVHRIARAIPAIRNLTPNWASWTHKKFPMGLALSMTMVAYLILFTINN